MNMKTKSGKGQNFLKLEIEYSINKEDENREI